MTISDNVLPYVSTLSFRCWPERMFNICRYSFRTKRKVRFFLHFYILEIGLPSWHSLWTTNNGETNKVSPRCINHVKCPKWIYHIKNEELLHGINEETNILHAIKRRKTKWIGHILRSNCLPTHCIEERIQGAERQRRWHKQLLDNYK
jgi:hypothetical protein